MYKRFICNKEYKGNQKFIELGYAPKPTNQLETFIYHVCHGIIMQYPLYKVLIWSFLQRKSFGENRVVDLKTFEEDGIIYIDLENLHPSVTYEFVEEEE